MPQNPVNGIEKDEVGPPSATSAIIIFDLPVTGS